MKDKESDEEEEDLRIIEIDPALALDKMATPQNHLLNDRRPALYKDISSEGDSAPSGEM